MREITDEDIKAAVLSRLDRLGKWGGNHTAFENLKKGFKPQELGRKGLKRVEECAKDLISEGLIVSKPTGYGLQVSLNPKKHQEIEHLIQEYVNRHLR